LAPAAGRLGHEALCARIGCQARLAFMYILRNDPRAAAALDEAEALAKNESTPIDTQALVAQVRGELLRRQGDRGNAIEKQLRALQLYEQSGNQQQVIRVCNTLALAYSDARDLPNTLRYANKVFDLAAQGAVDPEPLAAAHLNLGVAFFREGDLDESIRCQERSLEVSTRASMKTWAGRAHYNLAEAFYLRFQRDGDALDAAQGDTNAALSKAIWDMVGDKSAAAATSKLKRTVLGESNELIYDRMLPGELAAHFDEMSEVQAQRQRLERAGSAEERAIVQLRIARAYMQIAVKEREAALAGLSGRGIPANVEEALAALQRTFDAPLSRQDLLTKRWSAMPGCPTPAAMVRGAIELASEGRLTKSSYAQHTGLGLATASKHLALLAEQLLLTRDGRGPATRYLLPSERT
jgi:tetratricopeptide (TPR) repeat protein